MLLSLPDWRTFLDETPHALVNVFRGEHSRIGTKLPAVQCGEALFHALVFGGPQLRRRRRAGPRGRWSGDFTCPSHEVGHRHNRIYKPPARDASIRRPVSCISMAIAGGRQRGSRSTPPELAIMPILTSGRKNSATISAISRHRPLRPCRMAVITGGPEVVARLIREAARVHSSRRRPLRLGPSHAKNRSSV